MTKYSIINTIFVVWRDSMREGTIVLEGGAARGIFSAGVLDYLMEQDMYFKNVIGVSAGACNAYSYVSKQIGRSKESMIHEDYPFKYLNLRKCMKTGSLMDMDTLFDTIPNELYPVDYETFFASDMRCLFSVTNCITGKVDFIEVEERDDERLMRVCRASSSLPLVSPIVMIDGIPYLDGGIADSVPVRKALELGEEKVVVILTQQADYRKVPSSKGMNGIYEKSYSKYPELVKTIRRRYKQYNESMDMIQQLEKEGKIFVIRPTVRPVGRLEKKKETLEAFYNHGYQAMRAQFVELQLYLSE